MNGLCIKLTHEHLHGLLMYAHMSGMKYEHWNISMIFKNTYTISISQYRFKTDIAIDKNAYLINRKTSDKIDSDKKFVVQYGQKTLQQTYKL